jgi:TonB family protein
MMRAILGGLFAIAQTVSASAFAANNTLIPPRCDPAHHNATVEEIYSPRGLRVGEQSSIVLTLRIDETGHVLQVHVRQTSGSDRLDEAAVKTALRSWRFLPGTLDGKATVMDVSTTLKFATDVPSPDSCVKFDHVFIPTKPASMAVTQAS